ncbi:MAG: TIM barrel protein [Planctomycetota bacterium]
MRPALHLDPPLATIPQRLRDDGVDAFQTTLRDPQRYGKYGIPDEQDCAAYLTQVRAGAPPWAIVHGSLLTNLASRDGRIRNSSVSSLIGDLALALQLGFPGGVCFHAGYAKGHDTIEQALAEAARKLAQVIEKMPVGALAVIENACEGGELGQTIAEVAAIVRGVGAPPAQLAVLIDTCHLHAAGFDLASIDAGERLAHELATHDLLDRLVAFHLNDCAGPVGCHRDRHAAPGAGTIQEGLLSIAHHPAFANAPCVLELDLEQARAGLRYLRGS